MLGIPADNVSVVQDVPDAPSTHRYRGHASSRNRRVARSRPETHRQDSICDSLVHIDVAHVSYPSLADRCERHGGPVWPLPRFPRKLLVIFVFINFRRRFDIYRCVFTDISQVSSLGTISLHKVILVKQFHASVDGDIHVRICARCPRKTPRTLEHERDVVI